jgi:hypothetical protein
MPLSRVASLHADEPGAHARVTPQRASGSHPEGVDCFGLVGHEDPTMVFERKIPGQMNPRLFDRSTATLRPAIDRTRPAPVRAGAAAPRRRRVDPPLRAGNPQFRFVHLLCNSLPRSHGATAGSLVDVDASDVEPGPAPRARAGSKTLSIAEVTVLGCTVGRMPRRLRIVGVEPANDDYGEGLGEPVARGLSIRSEPGRDH